MTRNELLELANAFYTGGFTEREIAFARVIAAVEREACAKVCEEQEELRNHTPVDCVIAIRARGNT
jgi:hypothetical protein